ncbi:hypothetical protein GCM10023238_27450 [Streptomyces heliomycini]
MSPVERGRVGVREGARSVTSWGRGCGGAARPPQSGPSGAVQYRTRGPGERRPPPHHHTPLLCIGACGSVLPGCEHVVPRRPSRGQSCLPRCLKGLGGTPGRHGWALEVTPSGGGTPGNAGE